MDVEHRWHVMDLWLVTVQWDVTAPLNSAAQRASISTCTGKESANSNGGQQQKGSDGRRSLWTGLGAIMMESAGTGGEEMVDCQASAC